jgi:hypothetical protein
VHLRKEMKLTSDQGAITISGGADLSAYAGLGELLEEHLISHHLPRALEIYRSGGSVTFGPLVVSKRGLSTQIESQRGLCGGTKVLSWKKFGGLRLSNATLQITRKPANRVWLGFSLQDIPNVALLLTFLHALVEERQQDLPR